MPLYIVRPKRPLTHQMASVMSTSLSAEARQGQIVEIASIRADDPVDRQIHSWVQDSDPSLIREITAPRTGATITGTRLLEMTPLEAEQMKRDLPDAMVFADRPIELIRPEILADSATSAVAEADLWHIEKIGLRSARQNGFQGTGAGVRVAILDSGIAPHPEVRDRVDSAWSLNIPNWKVDRVEPTFDTQGHGTQVAGIIAGKTIGIAPGASLVNVIMLPRGFGNLSDFILAMEWAGGELDPPVQIVNMSAGLRGFLPEMREPVAALLAAGVLPVFAVGNEGRNSTRSPGNYKEPLSVGATNRQDKVSSFSGSGTIVADSHQYNVPSLVAPGEDIYSCAPSGGFLASRGTSLAAPIVAAVACLILERHPRISLPDLIGEILDSCQNIGQDASRQGSGLVQCTAAIQ